MASTLKGLWITHDKPMQAKTNVRIEAHNANADLGNLLSQRIDLTQTEHYDSVKLKGSKIYSDNGSGALFTSDGDIEEAVKVKGYTNTLKQVLTLGTDKAKSQCQLYIDSDICLGNNCKFSVTRVMFEFDTGTGDLINPFSTATSTAIQIGSTSFSENYLKMLFDNVEDKYSVPLSNHIAYTFLFCKEFCSQISNVSSYEANQSLFYTTAYGYLYIKDNATVTITNTDVFYNISNSYSNICVHIAGVAGACAGKKVDTGLPPSNIFKTGMIPDLLFNCDPFDCRQDYILGSDYKLPACITGCPYDAIKHKQTLTTDLPVDTNNQIKVLSSLKMSRLPFLE